MELPEVVFDDFKCPWRCMKNCHQIVQNLTLVL